MYMYIYIYLTVIYYVDRMGGYYNRDLHRPLAITLYYNVVLNTQPLV